MTPERLFQRRWAITILNHGIDRLRNEYEAAGKLPLFDALKGRLGPVGDNDHTPYAELGASLNLSEGAPNNFFSLFERIENLMAANAVAITIAISPPLRAAVVAHLASTPDNDP